MDTIKDSLDDYLVAIADGVARAQGRLDAGTGGSTAYHIPRVDFELKLTLTVEGGGAAPARLAVRPPSSEDVELLTTVRGSLVATPIQAGRGRPRLTLALRGPTQAEARRLVEGAHAQVIVVKLTDGAGEPLADEAVAVDLDREASALLNREAGLAAPTAKSWVLDVALVTGGDGIATTALNLSAEEPEGASFVIVATAASQSRTAVYQLPGARRTSPGGPNEEVR